MREGPGFNRSQGTGTDFMVYHSHWIEYDRYYPIFIWTLSFFLMNRKRWDTHSILTFRVGLDSSDVFFVVRYYTQIIFQRTRVGILGISKEDNTCEKKEASRWPTSLDKKLQR